MAHPHPTPDVPGRWPHLYEEVKNCSSKDDVSAQLLSGLGSDHDPSEQIPTGHVCATTWIFEPGGRYVLLVRHRLFGWSAPGGHIEPHETSSEGGLRELEEETGLTRFDVTSILDGPALTHVSDLPGDRPHRHWNIAWLYTAEMDSPLAPSEGARWWSVDSLPVGRPDLSSTASRLLAILDRHRNR
jgi:8-oxo-dGTP pyrophosphatase MutT (NUDIX family)